MGRDAVGIRELLIDNDRDDHIARHGVVVGEVQDVVFGRHMSERTREGRLLLVGQTRGGRYLTIVVAPRDSGAYRLVTARNSTAQERSRYRANGASMTMDDNSKDQPRPRPSRIPTFATIAEEAAFWDSHDITEFEDELEPADDVTFDSIRSSQGLILRLDGDVLDRIERIAAVKGTDPTTVARTWIEEGLRQETDNDPRLAS